jgi:TolB-like protein
MWVADEAAVGRKKRNLVPIAIDAVEPAIGFRQLQTLAFDKWNGDAASPEYRELVAALKSRIGGSKEVAPAPEKPAQRLSASQPSIAVLPFDDLSDARDQDYFADGLVEDIITGLSHIPQLLVISRSSTFPFKGRDVGVAEIVERLGARYLLRGSVRRAGERLRVTAQLVNGESDHVIWSKKYDRDVARIFEVQDELTDEIVSSLDIEIVSGEQGRHRRGKVNRTESIEILYKGMFEYHKYERPAGFAARAHFEEFVRREPDSLLGYVWLAMAWSFSLIVGWEKPETALSEARKNADKALAIDQNDPQALVRDAICRVLVGKLDHAIASAERAARILPNLDDAWYVLGWAQMLSGDSKAAIDSQKRAMRLCPIMHAVQLGLLATSYRNAGLYDDSIETFSECLKRFPTFVYAEAGRAVAYGMKGDLAAAKESVAAALKSDPNYTIARFTNPNLYRDKSVMENVAKVLRAAGMPDG